MGGENLFSLDGKVAIITGGTGVLGGAMARGLAAAGARVGVLGRRQANADAMVADIQAAGGQAMALPADVLDKEQLQAARAAVLDAWGSVDILINAAGGNMPGATVFGDLTFFDLSREAVDQVMALNFTGTLLPSQVFGEPMAEQGSGSIINISSMAAQRPLTRVIGYAASKSAIDNLTRWLAIDWPRSMGRACASTPLPPASSSANRTAPCCSTPTTA